MFYTLYGSQHRIIVDFYQQLLEEQYDYCMTADSERKADTPRQSLAHILYVQLVYLNGARTGKLEFKSMSLEHYSQLSKTQLLAELERIDLELFTFLTAESFDASAGVEVPWGGKMNVMDLLYFLRDHDILHIGWNLALMDHLNIPRFPSLIQYWG